MAVRDNFTLRQKQAALAVNAWEVKSRWRTVFGDLPDPYYICEHCRFVSADRKYFEVDHIVSCKAGGNANRETLERITALEIELQRPLDQQGIAVIMSANLNDQVLCVGCNQGKKSMGHGQMPDEIPQGCGYAYRRHEEDKNPDHMYAGPPRTTGYVKPRYRMA
jgi:hypothetical protein